MTLTRRKTLALIGGGTLFAAGAGGGLILTRAPRTADAPWGLAGTYDDPRLRALSYAILAPNPHNRQPWMVDLSRPETVVLYVDTSRLLPHTDPFRCRNGARREPAPFRRPDAWFDVLMPDGR
jgi:hypothetical protein